MLLQIYSQNTKWLQIPNEGSGLTVNPPRDDLSVAFGSPRLDQHQPLRPFYSGLLLIFTRAPFIMFCCQQLRFLKRRCHREPKSHETELRQHRHRPELLQSGGTGSYGKQITTRSTEASLNISRVSGFSSSGSAPFCCLTHQQPGDRAVK